MALAMVACSTGEAAPTAVQRVQPLPDASAADASVSPETRPSLASLTVSPLALEPSFSPDVHDYYVRCAAGDNRLTVSATASAGATASLSQPITTGPAEQLRSSLTARESQAIVVSVREGSAEASYWVRCLPHDFPRLAFTPHPEAGTPPPGYYFVGDVFYGSGEAGYGMVLDGRGVPVWYGRTLNGAGAKTVQMLDGNHISYVPIAGYTFGTYEGSWEVHTLDPVGVSYVTSVGMPVDTHELRRLPNGDFLVFATPVRTGVDLTGLDGYGSNESILDCVIQELAPSGDLVWEWTGSEHMHARSESTYAVTQRATTVDGKTKDVVDPFHCNSIDWDASGDLLVSVRDLDALILVSKATERILWKIGGTQGNKDNAAHIAMVDDAFDGFYRQHHARFLPDGTISVFDDESSRSKPARGVIFSYDVGAGTASVVWQYVGTKNVPAMGSVTILPDGSRVVGWGNTSHVFTETNEQGADLLDFTFPDGDESYRAIKVPLSALDLAALRAGVEVLETSRGLADAGGDGPADGG